MRQTVAPFPSPPRKRLDASVNCSTTRDAARASTRVTSATGGKPTPTQCAQIQRVRRAKSTDRTADCQKLFVTAALHSRLFHSGTEAPADLAVALSRAAVSCSKIPSHAATALLAISQALSFEVMSFWTLPLMQRSTSVGVTCQTGSAAAAEATIIRTGNINTSAVRPEAIDNRNARHP